MITMREKSFVFNIPRDLNARFLRPNGTYFDSVREVIDLLQRYGNPATVASCKEVVTQLVDGARVGLTYETDRGAVVRYALYVENFVQDTTGPAREPPPLPTTRRLRFPKRPT